MLSRAEPRKSIRSPAPGYHPMATVPSDDPLRGERGGRVVVDPDAPEDRAVVLSEPWSAAHDSPGRSAETAWRSWQLDRPGDRMFVRDEEAAGGILRVV